MFRFSVDDHGWLANGSHCSTDAGIGRAHCRSPGNKHRGAARGKCTGSRLMGVGRQRTHMEIPCHGSRFAADQDGAYSRTGDGSTMIGGVSYSCCWRHKVILTVEGIGLRRVRPREGSQIQVEGNHSAPSPATGDPCQPSPRRGSGADSFIFPYSLDRFLQMNFSLVSLQFLITLKFLGYAVNSTTTIYCIVELLPHSQYVEEGYSQLNMIPEERLSCFQKITD